MEYEIINIKIESEYQPEIDNKSENHIYLKLSGEYLYIIFCTELLQNYYRNIIDICELNKRYKLHSRKISADDSQYDKWSRNVDNFEFLCYSPKSLNDYKIKDNNLQCDIDPIIYCGESSVCIHYTFNSSIEYCDLRYYPPSIDTDIPYYKKYNLYYNEQYNLMYYTFNNIEYCIVIDEDIPLRGKSFVDDDTFAYVNSNNLLVVLFCYNKQYYKLTLIEDECYYDKMDDEFNTIVSNNPHAFWITKDYKLVVFTASL